MNYRMIACLLLLPTFAVFAQQTDQIEHCERRFELLLMEERAHYCWIGESQYKPCLTDRVFQIPLDDIAPKPAIQASPTYGDWSWVNKLGASVRQAHQVTLNEGNGFSYPLAGLRLKAPAYNSKLYNAFLSHAYGTCGKEWNEGMGSAGLDWPRIAADRTPRLVYVHPDGLYFNYTIARAYYFPTIRFLVVFTEQAEKCGHGSRMQGFLVFKLE